jgi:all-trans-retinol dehydrogenase (NAD+)
MPKSILPREGLTLEALCAPVRLTLLQPILTGPLLLALSTSSPLVAKWIPSHALDVLRSKKIVAGISVLFGIGLLRKLNNALSRLVLNNFTADKTWDWNKEIVVITGGSGGLGAVIVQMFAEKNIKVIILDIAGPKTPITSLNPSLLFSGRR